MTCRFDTAGDPSRCDRCGESLWVVDEGLFCAECGVSMPCSMRVLPVPVHPAPAPRSGSSANG